MTLPEKSCAWPDRKPDINRGKVSDPLTGLPNRLLFIDRVGRLIKQYEAPQRPIVCRSLLDLEWVQVINDSMGHLIGDQLLLGVANRLEKCLRSADTVARLGNLHRRALRGDEFTVLLDDI